jgi:hypothetical protein
MSHNGVNTLQKRRAIPVLVAELKRLSYGKALILDLEADADDLTELMDWDDPCEWIENTLIGYELYVNQLREGRYVIIRVTKTHSWDT